jgi:hypothetical protein
MKKAIIILALPVLLMLGSCSTSRDVSLRDNDRNERTDDRGGVVVKRQKRVNDNGVVIKREKRVKDDDGSIRVRKERRERDNNDDRDPVIIIDKK